MLCSFALLIVIVAFLMILCKKEMPDMEKIVFVIPDMPGGGTERVVALLANEYSGRGIPVAILLFAGQETAYPLDPRIEVVSVGGPSGGSITARLGRLLRMRQFYRANKNCQIWSFSAMGAVFSALAALGQRHFFLVSERNDPNRYDHRRIRDLSYRRADVVVCQTKDAVESFPPGIRGKSVVIPNPLELEIPPCEGEREKRIVAVGRLSAQKNHRLLLEAFASFRKTHKDYVLELYGKGELEEELKAAAVRLGIDSCVRFKGFSDHVLSDIRTAAMYVLSSDYEGISNSMLEAMALGVPVIATDCPIGGSRMYIRDGVNGFLVPVGDADALAYAMGRLAEEPGLAERFGREAVKLKEELAVSRIADSFLELTGEGAERAWSGKQGENDE